MQLLKDKILSQAEIVNAHVLKVDSFLNHQVDPKLMQAIGKEFARKFKDKGITKVVTIETSGIAPAVFTALELGVDLVFARKGKSIVLNSNLYQVPVFSYTKEKEYSLVINKAFLNSDDKILFVDDFLANGQALMAVQELIDYAGAKMVGAGIVIEKSFEAGRARAEETGIEVYSLARISKLYADTIEFEGE
ncbi:MAG: xanthine phosphoribosyltransferase [Erysipelotrichaceae bacterium]|nr:xanthine phosphoribosyltransferase [Erysipelotrichaceae bacterium]